MKKNEQLDKKNVEDILALSPMQEGMLFHYLNNTGEQQYFEQLSLSIYGCIEPDIFKKAWNFVAETNEILRSVFRWDNLEKPLQIIIRKKEVPIFNHDFSLANEDEKAKLFEDVKLKDRALGIDIRTEPIRVTLCKIEDNRSEIIISNCHILYDGWSNGILIKEFLSAYDSFYMGRTPARPLKTTFKEFIKWQSQQDKKRQKEYWSDYLEGFSIKTELPLSKERNAGVFTVKKYNTIISLEQSLKLKEFAKTDRISLAVLLYASWGLLLQKCNNTNDVIFGTTVSGRNASLKNVENVIGLFINTIPLRVKSSENEKVSDILKKVDGMLKDRGEFECTPLVDIKSYCEINHNESLFDSTLVIENYPLDRKLNEESSQLELTSYSMEETTNFDLVVSVETFNEIKLNFYYNSQVFDSSKIEKLSDYYTNILNQMMKTPKSLVSQIEILSQEQKKLNLSAFNDTSVNYNRSLIIHKLFEEQVKKNPDNIAVVFEDRFFTYRELNERSNQLARILKLKGAGRDIVIGIMTGHSLEMLVGLMAVLKSGSAFLPIDPVYPFDRIAYMVEDSKISILLTQNKYYEKVSNLPVEILNIDNEYIYTGDNSDIECINKPNDLAYVIYTSGSTGKPKGAMIEHRSLVNLCCWFIDYYRVTESDRSTKYVRFGFDVTITEIFPYIISGAQVHMINENIRLDIGKLNEYFEANSITISFLPTQVCHQFMDMPNTSLRMLLAGGDKLNRYVQRNYRLVNNYGPTENTVVSTYFTVDRSYTNIPIGKPISNTKAYILDKDGNMQPPGAIGELYFSGAGLARGYINNPGLTAEKFLSNPFYEIEQNSDIYKRIYKTGDLARWLSDGTIEFIGRIDRQVKIRGYRIELGEIETKLLEHESVKDAAVICIEDNNDKYLCAYLVGKGTLSMTEIKEYLLKYLPYYMIPSRFVIVDKIPLTPNGKVDMKALPQPVDFIRKSRGNDGAGNEAEEKLLVIWKELLGVSEIGVNDNFFELGGHSLKAMALTSNINKIFEVDITVGAVFEFPTIRQLSEHIKQLEQKAFCSIEKIDSEECSDIAKKPLPTDDKDKCDFSASKVFAASSAQKRLFVLWQMNKDSTSYNMPSSMIIEGNLDLLRFEESLKTIIRRHETLRTSFEMLDDEIVQRVYQQAVFSVKYSETEEVNLNEKIQNFVQPFDLSTAPLLRAELISFAENKHLLLFDMHHIIADGVSVAILIEEFTRLYDNRSLPDLKIQYKDYAAWQQANIKDNGVLGKQGNYWKSIFIKDAPVLNLPYDYPRPSIQSFDGDCIQFEIDEELTAKLKTIAVSTNSTLYMLLISAYYVLLSKYSGQEDIVIGSPVAGRSHSDLYDLIGMFVNTIVLRNYPSGEKTFREFLYEVKRNAIKAFENQDYPFEELVGNFKQRDLSRNPLFDVMFVMQNMEDKHITIDNLKFIPNMFDNKISKFDATLFAKEAQDKLDCSIEYCTNLFSKETISAMTSNFTNILEQIAKNLDLRLAQIELLNDNEKSKLLYEFNSTNFQYNDDITIHELFEQQVEKTPDNIALVFGESKLTYNQLNMKANQIAGLLADIGVEPGTIVGIMAERSLDIMAAILGILKAGCAYLPINPEYPMDRIKYILEDSRAHILLASEKYKRETDSDRNEDREPIKIVDLKDERLCRQDCGNRAKAYSSDSLAYVIYTSGTTGKPKGIMIEHKAILNTLNWNLKFYDYTEKEVVLILDSFAFDNSLEDTFTPLLAGGSIVIPEQEKKLDLQYLSQIIKRNNVTRFTTVPAFYKVLLENIYTAMDSLKTIVVAGEHFSEKLVDEHFSRLSHVKLYNEYGPTENSVCTTAFEFNKNNTKICIGKPIFNTRCYILDANLKMQPVGVPGELYISGAGLSRGYLNRPELTNERFIQDISDPSKKMYKTGDLVRWLPDGNIEFLGRMDHQIKIRGFRIEPGEIESQLLKHEAIKEAVVVPCLLGGGDAYLCAYIVSEEQFTAAELKELLSGGLPGYMIPSYFKQLEKMPLTPNGKIDLKALPAPDVDMTADKEKIPPSGEIEEKLVELWQEILDVKNIGVNDNFFDLGGHSLKATVFVSRVHKELNVELPLRQVLQTPTVKELSEYIENSKINAYSAIEQAEEKEYYPTSSAQKRMFILSQFKGVGTAYNTFSILLAEGQIDRKRLEEIFRKLIERHEAFRTAFELADDQPVQKILQHVDFQIEYMKQEQLEIKEILSRIIKPFDLSVPPLMRITMVELDSDRHLLVIDMHHIISDGTSMGILIKEFIQIYEGQELPKLRVQYKDFSCWQNELFTSSVVKKQEEYWLGVLSGTIPTLKMPTDYPRPWLKSFKGCTISFEADNELTRKLYSLVSETGATLYMILFAAYYVLLWKYTGQEDIIVGTVTSGRQNADVENVVGMFVNTLAIRNYPSGNKTFYEFLEEVKESTLTAFENQDYQFEMLVDKLKPVKEIGRNPLFDTMFILQNIYIPENVEIDGLKFSQYEYDDNTVKLDFRLEAIETENRIKFNLAYSTKLFKDETMKAFSENYIKVLNTISDKKEIKIEDINE